MDFNPYPEVVGVALTVNDILCYRDLGEENYTNSRHLLRLQLMDHDKAFLKRFIKHYRRMDNVLFVMSEGVFNEMVGTEFFPVRTEMLRRLFVAKPLLPESNGTTHDEVMAYALKNDIKTIVVLGGRFVYKQFVYDKFYHCKATRHFDVPPRLHYDIKGLSIPRELKFSVVSLVSEDTEILYENTKGDFSVIEYNNKSLQG